MKSVRLDCEDIVETVRSGSNMTHLCDLQGDINKWPGNGALVYAGSPTHKFNLWIPDRDSSSSRAILNLIENRYSCYGRGYVYVSVKRGLHPSNESGKPKSFLLTLLSYRTYLQLCKVPVIH